MACREIDLIVIHCSATRATVVLRSTTLRRPTAAGDSTDAAITFISARTGI